MVWLLIQFLGSYLSKRHSNTAEQAAQDNLYKASVTPPTTTVNFQQQQQPNQHHQQTLPGDDIILGESKPYNQSATIDNTKELELAAEGEYTPLPPD